MITAEWLFRNHCDHVAMAKLLEIQLDTEATSISMTEKERDEEIAAMVLARPTYDGLPKSHGKRGNSTERTVLALNRPELAMHIAELQKQLTVYRYLLRTYDSLMSILEDSEQQFITYYYGKRLSLSGMTEAVGSPVYGLSKTTVWTYKKILLTKCDSLLCRLCPSLCK